MREKREVKYQMKVLSSLVKVFPDEEPVYRPECVKLSGLWDETVSYQVAYTGNHFLRERVDVKVVSPIAEYVRVRTVEQVPVGRATNGIVDDNYLKTTSGLYPDLLKDIKDGKVIIRSHQWSSLWIDVKLTDEIPAGDYEIEIQLVKDDAVICSAKENYSDRRSSSKTENYAYGMVPRRLPCRLLSCGCFSEKHWEILENYFHEYVDRGCNMMMVPLFTYPLDMAVGNDRTTTQLIKVEVKNGEYHFGFDKMKRWVDLCKKCGIEYYEMSHLFSQWGAKYAPKVMALVDGKEERIFGWHTPAVGEYTRFLQAFLPRLVEKLKEWGIAEVTYFHISDEPREEHLETFKAAKESLGNMLDGFHTFDALSSYEFYKHGLISKPIPGNNEIEEFLEHGLTDMWTYYCTGQFYEVSNRFMSMPSARNRIYGIQLYKYDIIGILHWGYNFYNSQHSYEHINPYQVTDASNGFPAGDPFLVYPGADGHPEESIRMMVHYEALTDLRALELLESLTSKEYVMELIEEDLDEPLTFKRYPKSDMYLIALRNKVNKEIARLSSAS